MNKKADLSPLGEELLEGLTAFRDTLAEGGPVDQRFTVRTVTLDLQTKPYHAKDVKELRDRLRASQALFAQFLGVSLNTIRAWEQGLRPVPEIACRFMDEVSADPGLWNRRLKSVKSGS